MSTTYALFEKWKTKKGFSSSMSACAELGLSRASATNWKNGANAEAHVIERMANDLGERPAAWVLAAASEKVRAAAERRALLRMARSLGYAASLLCTVGISYVQTVGTLPIM